MVRAVDPPASRPLPVAPLTTARLALRAPCADDAARITALAGDFDVARRLARMPHPYTAEDARFFFEAIAPVETVWAITRRGDAAFLGVVSWARRETRGGEGDLALGYWLGRPYWGRGYMSEAASAALAYARAVAPAARLVAGCFLDNEASFRILTKLGFVETGRSLCACLALGRTRPHRDLEWRAQ